MGSVQRRGCETGQRGKQAVLEVRVADGRVWSAEPLVKPVAAAAARLGFLNWWPAIPIEHQDDNFQVTIERS
jgi:hypothetical protein